MTCATVCIVHDDVRYGKLEMEEHKDIEFTLSTLTLKEVKGETCLLDAKMTAAHLPDRAQLGL